MKLSLFFIVFSDKTILSLVLKRETEKEARTKQNSDVQGLSPLLTTCHLPSIKIFFVSVQLEKFSTDGQVIGDIDQGDSSAEEDEPDEPKAEE